MKAQRMLPPLVLSLFGFLSANAVAAPDTEENILLHGEMPPFSVGDSTAGGELDAGVMVTHTRETREGVDQAKDTVTLEAGAHAIGKLFGMTEEVAGVDLDGMATTGDFEDGEFDGIGKAESSLELRFRGQILYREERDGELSFGVYRTLKINEIDRTVTLGPINIDFEAEAFGRAGIEGYGSIYASSDDGSPGLILGVRAVAIGTGEAGTSGRLWGYDFGLSSQIDLVDASCGYQLDTSLTHADGTLEIDVTPLRFKLWGFVKWWEWRWNWRDGWYRVRKSINKTFFDRRIDGVSYSIPLH